MFVFRKNEWLWRIVKKLKQYQEKVKIVGIEIWTMAM